MPGNHRAKSKKREERCTHARDADEVEDAHIYRVMPLSWEDQASTVEELERVIHLQGLWVVVACTVLLELGVSWLQLAFSSR